MPVKGKLSSHFLLYIRQSQIPDIQLSNVNQFFSGTCGQTFIAVCSPNKTSQSLLSESIFQERKKKEMKLCQH